jgi:hypothetical protein
MCSATNNILKPEDYDYPIIASKTIYFHKYMYNVSVDMTEAIANLPRIKARRFGRYKSKTNDEARGRYKMQRWLSLNLRPKCWRLTNGNTIFLEKKTDLDEFIKASPIKILHLKGPISERHLEFIQNTSNKIEVNNKLYKKKYNTRVTYTSKNYTTEPANSIYNFIREQNRTDLEVGPSYLSFKCVLHTNYETYRDIGLMVELMFDRNKYKKEVTVLLKEDASNLDEIFKS